MPCQLIQKMRACGSCRTLATAYGMNLATSRRPGAHARGWTLRLAVTRTDLEDHLITEHPNWLPGRAPDCDTCEAWGGDHTIGPTSEAEALHRAWHLCEPLRLVSTDGHHDLSYLI
ncbi:hypothetical protein [Streptomyces hygroscopicus]|uniref:hypothetical protein n=1 Tax=Streptomyces hygroscopicus TaxID=1912 RepID=UPI001FCA715D|nr:hypothetical protein [Streptomyces hygroscopicus]BDH10464.1 hypothetical protein HOK021_16430 [Streptomyces hygroscopicus]